MDFYDALYATTKNEGVSIETLCEMIGKSRTYIFSAKSRGSVPGINTAANIFDALGYSICVVPKASVPDNAIVIEYEKNTAQ